MDVIDSLPHRAAVMTGRAQALAEAMSLVRRLSDRIEPDMAHAEAHQILVLAWSELLTWLEQAGVEAAQESKLMRQELNLPA